MPYIHEDVTNGSGKPALSNREWMDRQLQKIQDAYDANELQRALDLIEEGLTKTRMWTNLRLWESSLMSRKSKVLTGLGRLEEAQAAAERAKWLMDHMMDLIDSD
ncbi:hypothetical protein PWT90_07625 [Aphanocladium album]|nr:hypothetical protein PWT90_07625 [Aphanocladium album]